MKKEKILGLVFGCLLVCGGIFILPNSTHAADFYVSTSGTDDPSYGGSTGSGAWASLWYALTSSRVDKGDTIYVQEGTYTEKQTNVAVGAGDGTAVTVRNYGTDVVTIQTASGVDTPANGLYFINSVDMVFDGINIDNNSVAMGGKYLFAVYSTTRSTSLTFQNATIDASSAGTIRVFKLYGSQPHNLVVNKTDISNGGMVVETSGSGVTNNNVTFFSSLIRSGFVAFFSSTTSATNIILKNNLFTRFSGYGFFLDAATTTVTAKNNIFVGGGAYDQTIWNLGTDFGVAAISNNALFDVAYNYCYSEDSPFVMTTYGEIISSGQVVPYIAKQNWFVDPSFTSLGTDYTLAAGSLIAQRGTNDHPTDGTDINGVSYGTNDVGPYVNPTLTALPALDSDEAAWHGDSIVAGIGASGESTKSATVFGTYTGDTVVNYGISGQFTRGLFWAVDQSIWTGREASAVIGIGVNDVVGPKVSQTNAQVADKITTTMEKLDDAGISPVYLGVHSIAGNPPDNTAVDAISSSVGTTCTSEGWSCGEIVTQMENNASWKTEYYADLTTNVHPDDDGHAVMARLAEYLYYTKSTMGTDEVDVGAGARLYYDGEFRNIGTPSAVTADFTVTPVGGVGSFDSNDKSAYMDITINTWIESGDKEWVASSQTGAGFTQAGSTVYTIGDLRPNSRYQFKLDGVASEALTGSTCTGSLCVSDGSGSLEFTYTGGYSSHTFALTYIRTGGSTPALPAPDPSITSDSDEGVTDVVSETSTASGTCEEGLNPGDGIVLSWDANSSVHLVNIYYSTNDGESYKLIDGPIVSTGNYAWSVPSDISGSTLQFMIEGTDLVLITTSLESEICSLNGLVEEVDDTDATDDEVDTTEVVAPSGIGVSPVTGEEEEITEVEPGDYITSPSFATVYYITENFERRAFINSATFFTYADSYDEIKDVTDATLTTLELGDNMLPNPGVVLVKIKSDPRTYAIDENYNLRWIASEEVALELYGEGWSGYIIDIEATFFGAFGAGDDVNFANDISLIDMKTREEVSQ